MVRVSPVSPLERWSPCGIFGALMPTRAVLRLDRRIHEHGRPLRVLDMGPPVKPEGDEGGYGRVMQETLEGGQSFPPPSFTGEVAAKRTEGGGHGPSRACLSCLNENGA